VWKLDESSGEWTFKDAWKVGAVIYRHNTLGSYWLAYDLGSRRNRVQTFMGTPRIRVNPRVILVRPDSQDMGTNVL
jgi:hypothetical protein